MLARSLNGLVLEFRDIDVSEIPPHKLDQWLPVVDTMPEFDPRCQTRSGPVVTIVPGVSVTRVWAVESRDIDAVRKEFCARVDADAEAVRMKYMTPGSGMALTYDEKRRQAAAIIAGGQAAADALTQAEADTVYPTLAASIGIEAVSLWGCAQIVAAKAAAWGALSNVIEKTRLRGKAAIEAAATVTEAAAAYDAITWTM